jgi:hypothetical protein
MGDEIVRPSADLPEEMLREALRVAMKAKADVALRIGVADEEPAVGETGCGHVVRKRRERVADHVRVALGGAVELDEEPLAAGRVLALDRRSANEDRSRFDVVLRGHLGRRWLLSLRGRSTSGTMSRWGNARRAP